MQYLMLASAVLAMPFVALLFVGALPVKVAAAVVLLAIAVLASLVVQWIESATEEDDRISDYDEMLLRMAQMARQEELYRADLEKALLGFGSSYEEDVKFIKKDPSAEYVAYRSVRRGLRIARVIGETPRGICVLRLANGAIVHRSAANVKGLNATTGYIPLLAYPAIA